MQSHCNNQCVFSSAKFQCWSAHMTGCCFENHDAVNTGGGLGTPIIRFEFGAMPVPSIHDWCSWLKLTDTAHFFKVKWDIQSTVVHCHESGQVPLGSNVPWENFENEGVFLLHRLLSGEDTISSCFIGLINAISGGLFPILTAYCAEAREMQEHLSLICFIISGASDLVVCIGLCGWASNTTSSCEYT